MGKFIVLEGIEGVGKTTNMDFIAQYLQQHHIDFIRTREPGGTPLAEKMRDIVLHAGQEEPLNAEAELLLMFAARAQHLAQVIHPALQQGLWVVCDRFTDASYAYQGGGRNIDPKRIEILEHWVQDGLRPDGVIILDVPVELAFARTLARKNQDRIEQESSDFFNRVRQVYLARAKINPERYHVVNAAQALPAVQAEIKKILDQLTENDHAG